VIGLKIIFLQTVSRFFMKKNIHNIHNIHIGEIILKKLEETERSIAWLARQVHTDRSNLYRQLKNQAHINIELLYRISIVLETDFFHHYSTLLKHLKHPSQK
jgi:DNA-binding phage protein